MNFLEAWKDRNSWVELFWPEQAAVTKLEAWELDILCKSGLSTRRKREAELVLEIAGRNAEEVGEEWTWTFSIPAVKDMGRRPDLALEMVRHDAEK